MSWLIYTILGALPLIYWYLMRNFNYWAKRGLNGPKPIPLFGNLIELIIDTQVVKQLDWFNKYGKIYGYYIGTKPILSVSDPEYIKTILVKDFHLFPDRKLFKKLHPVLSKSLLEANGDDWKRIRSILSPAFTSGKMKKMCPLINECLNKFILHLETYAKNRKVMNAKDMFGNYTMDVIATCAFATKINIENRSNSPFVVNAGKIFDSNYFKMIMEIFLPSKIISLFKLHNANEEKYFFLDNAKLILDKRRKSGKKYNDFVQLLIDANIDSADYVLDDVVANESHHLHQCDNELDIGERSPKINVSRKTLTEEEQCAQAVLFLLGGYETTATTLTYSVYELALQPEIQQRLADEVNGALDSNGEISYEVLARLPFLDAIISETLRLHTPAFRLVRTATTDYKLGDTGLELEKGQLIEIPSYAIHHAEEFYPEPFKFIPDRFMPENRHLLTPYTYLPFGVGPRHCIGMRFALLEAKLALAHIVRKYRFFSCPQTDIPINYKWSHLVNTPISCFVGIEKKA